MYIYISDSTAIKSYSPELIVHPVLKAQSTQMLALSLGTRQQEQDATRQQEQDAVEALIARSTSEVALCIPYICMCFRSVCPFHMCPFYL